MGIEHILFDDLRHGNHLYSAFLPGCEQSFPFLRHDGTHGVRHQVHVDTWQLPQQAIHRARSRRVERRRKEGKLRFTLLALSIVVTAVIVTIVMFETLAMLAG